MYFETRACEQTFNSTTHAHFVTLTIAPQHHVITPNGLATLDRKMISSFVKRLQVNAKRLFDYHPRIRVFGAGEYGTKGEAEHPHYHLVIWGVPLSLITKLVYRSWSRKLAPGEQWPPNISKVYKDSLRNHGLMPSQMRDKDKKDLMEGRIPIGAVLCKVLDERGISYINKYMLKDQILRSEHNPKERANPDDDRVDPQSVAVLPRQPPLGADGLRLFVNFYKSQMIAFADHPESVNALKDWCAAQVPPRPFDPASIRWLDTVPNSMPIGYNKMLGYGYDAVEKKHIPQKHKREYYTVPLDREMRKIFAHEYGLMEPTTHQKETELLRFDATRKLTNEEVNELIYTQVLQNEHSHKIRSKIDAIFRNVSL